MRAGVAASSSSRADTHLETMPSRCLWIAHNTLVTTRGGERRPDAKPGDIGKSTGEFSTTVD